MAKQSDAPKKPIPPGWYFDGGKRTTGGMEVKKTIIPVAAPIKEWVENNHEADKATQTLMYNILWDEAIRRRDPKYKGMGLPEDG